MMPSEELRAKLANLLDAIHEQRVALNRNLARATASQARALQTIQAMERKLCDALHPSPEAAQIVNRIGSLSPRQRRVFERVVAGESNKAIAFELGLSQKTVETHRARVMKKMQATSLAQLVRIASRAVGANGHTDGNGAGSRTA